MRLIVAGLAPLGSYVSREFHHLLTDLVTRCGWRHVETSKLMGGPEPLREKLLREFGELPQWILFWETYGLIHKYYHELRTLPARKCIFADDLHDNTSGSCLMRLACFLECDVVFAAYEDVLRQLYPLVARNRQILWVPHAATPVFDLEFNPSAENRVLLSGAIDRHYPLRQQMRQLCEAGTLPITWHRHPGYHCGFDHANDPNVGAGYARLINRFRTAFTDALKYRYVVAKYFEIPATGALLLADGNVSEPLRRLGYLPGTHYWPVSSQNLERELKHVLMEENHPALDQVRRQGQQLVQERHQTRHRADLINNFCRP